MLNNEQYLIVENIDGNILVVAVAGSGKTHVLKYGVAQLLNINPDYRILMITFTNSAMAEMKSRVRTHLLENNLNPNSVEVRTFHSIMLEMGRMIDNRKLIMNAEVKNYIYRAFIESGVKTRMENAIEFVEFYSQQTHAEHDIELDPSGGGWKIYSAYHRLMEKENVKDFSFICKQVLQSVSDGTIDKLGYSHYLIDEFQDCDSTQLAWIIEHGKQEVELENGQVTPVKVITVGDDDQSIYGWRGSTGYSNMTSQQEELDADGFHLTTCYRCAPEILEVANKVISFNTNRIEKVMKSLKEFGEGLVNYTGFDSSESEYLAMAKVISVDERNWGVLARDNATLDEIQRVFESYNIEYKRMSGKSFFEIFEVNMLLHMIHPIVNTKAYYSLRMILGYFDESEESIAELTSMASQLDGIHKIYKYAVDAGYYSITTRLLNIYSTQRKNTTDEMEIVRYVREIIELVMDAKPTAVGSGKEQSLVSCYMDTLSDKIASSNGSYHSRLKRLTKQLEPAKKNKEIDRDVCTLTTMHGGKGLEWDKVWVVGLDDGVLPKSTEHCELESLEEDRRLLYVAITRAESELHISSSTKNPSFFLQQACPEWFMG